MSDYPSAPVLVLKNPAQNVTKWERRFPISREDFIDLSHWTHSYPESQHGRSYRLIPRIRIVDEMPGWIMCTTAAYHPWTRTIWLIRRPLWKMAINLFHETVHHGIEVLTGSQRVHYIFDWLWGKLFVRKK